MFEERDREAARHFRARFGRVQWLVASFSGFQPASERAREDAGIWKCLPRLDAEIVIEGRFARAPGDMDGLADGSGRKTESSLFKSCVESENPGEIIVLPLFRPAMSRRTRRPRRTGQPSCGNGACASCWTALPPPALVEARFASKMRTPRCIASMRRKKSCSGTSKGTRIGS